MSITINAAAAKFIFEPVSVNRGRKFRGDAYALGYGEEISSSNWAYTSYSVKLWCPSENRYVYANPDFVEGRQVSVEQVAADKQAYAEHTIQGTIDWCKSQKPNDAEDEILRFARNILRKRHPEMIDLIDVATPDTRVATPVVESTLNWAAGLKTRPCHMYGRFCPGGKDLSDKRKVEIAWSSCVKKGITKLPDFEAAWTLGLTLHGWAKYLKQFPA